MHPTVSIVLLYIFIFLVFSTGASIAGTKVRKQENGKVKGNAKPIGVAALFILANILGIISDFSVLDTLMYMFAGVPWIVTGIPAFILIPMLMIVHAVVFLASVFICVKAVIIWLINRKSDKQDPTTE